ncbi:mitochondrial import translocase, subunit Tom22 [Choiromyces venosus 120613-1]|uniref:Mitochondrial import translocase, subunit Tom22 n=1 Tax=Choiromyces venosus 120613-1 TaxID=1336337 RepID=A0A3N4JHD6_9PEZI|nr:mitochondrial import translocase, subunit Tom22 [Choiromyces venosus 120613-1]
MVHIKEVEDQYFSEQRQGQNYDYDDYDYQHSSASSSVGSDEEDEGDDDYDESLYDRIVALREMIPVHQRARIVNVFEKVHMVLSGGLKFGGNVLWVVGTSALVLGVPFAVAIGEEQQLLDMEREAAATGSAAESLAPGAESAFMPQKER